MGNDSELNTARDHLRSLLNEKVNEDKLEAFDAKFEWLTGLLSTLLIVIAVVVPIWQAFLALLGAVVAAFITGAYKYAISRRSIPLRLFVVVSGLQALFAMIMLTAFLGLGFVVYWVSSLSEDIFIILMFVFGGASFFLFAYFCGIYLQLRERVAKLWKNVRIQPNPEQYELEKNIDLAALYYSSVAYSMGIFLFFFVLFLGGLFLPRVLLEILILTGIDFITGAGGLFVILDVVLGSLTLIPFVWVLIEYRRIPERIKTHLETINRIMSDMSDNSSVS